MKVFKAVDGSTIYDVCLNTYGTLNLLGKLMSDNNYPGVDTLPVAGQLFTYDDTLVSSPSASRSLVIPGRKYATAFKRVLVLLVLFFSFSTAGEAQKKWEPINGNYKWVDSLQFLRFKNTPNKDSVLSTDSTGKMILVARGGGVLPADTVGKWVGSIYKKAGTDSIFYVKGSTSFFAYRDSSGGGGGSAGIDSVVIKSVPYVDSFFTYKEGVKSWRGNIRKKDGLLNGGEVTRVSGYDFNVTAAYYVIAGVDKNTPNTAFIIPTPGVSDSARYYAVTATSANTVQILPGDMSSTPVFPTIEPTERVLLGFIYVSPDSVGLVQPPTEVPLWVRAGPYIVNTNPGGVQVTNGLFFDQPGRIFSGLLPLKLQSNLTTGSRIFTGVIGGNPSDNTVELETGGGDISNTSGVKRMHLITGRMLHSSGSGTVNMLEVLPNFAQTAGGSGAAVNGLYIHGLLSGVYGAWNAIRVGNGRILLDQYAGGGVKNIVVNNDGYLDTASATGAVGTLQQVVLNGNTADKEIYIEGARIHYSPDSLNLFFGVDAGGYFNGQENIGIGGNALSNGEGDQNTALGMDAGNGSLAYRSIYLGSQAGKNNIYDDVIIINSADNAADSAKQIVFPNLRVDIGKLTTIRKIRVPDANGTIALTSDINPGTVTTLLKTDDYGVQVSITTPTSTPNIRVKLDTITVFQRAREIIDSLIRTTAVLPADTVGKWVGSIYKKAGTDSIFYVKGSTSFFAYRDSSGGGGGGSPDTVRTVRSTGVYVDTVAGLRYLKGDTLILATKAYVKHYVDSLVALKVTANAAITGATKTKITYDSKGLVTAGADIAASDMPTGIDAAKINTGVVSNTEFNRLDGLSSNIIQASDTTGWLRSSGFTDYSGTSTITGFSSYTTKLIQTETTGKTMVVMFYIEGTGSGTTTSFTLPANATSWGTQQFIVHTRNNTTQAASVAYVTASSNVVTISSSASLSNISSWTNATGRSVAGQFHINIQ